MYASHIVREAVGDASLESASVLQLSGHRRLTSLGHALSSSRALTHLDLSRNGLTTMQGLQSLHQLRKLSLYYNAIADLAEVALLRHHPSLAVLDMRLNPVWQLHAFMWT